MSVCKKYYCDICKEECERQLLGIKIEEGVFCGQSLTENHLCFRCISTIQDMESICAGGFRCNGGPNCTSDHN